MFKPFKEILVAEFSAVCVESLPEFAVLKSASRGGGVTFRRKLDARCHLFIGVEPTQQRERAQLFVGWSRLGRVPQFGELQWQNLHSAPLDPIARFCAQDEGFLDVTEFGQFMNEIELEPLWVPWPVIAERLKVDERLLDVFRRIWGEELATMALEERVDPSQLSMSWEQWFGFIDPVLPSDPSVTAVMASFVAEMRNQVQALLVPFLNACAAESNDRVAASN